MIAPGRQVVLFDSSALNHLFGQSPHVDEGMRVPVIERMKATAPTVVALNAGLLGEGPVSSSRTVRGSTRSPGSSFRPVTRTWSALPSTTR